MKKKLFTALFSLFLIGGIIQMTSCQKQVEEIIEKYTFDVNVTNNTADDLEIYDSTDGGDNWTDVGAVLAGKTSLKRGFPIDTEVIIEARKNDGTVHATKTFKEGGHTVLDWVID